MPWGELAAGSGPNTSPMLCAPTQRISQYGRSADACDWGSTRPTSFSTRSTPACSMRPTPETHAGLGARRCASLQGHQWSPPARWLAAAPKGPNTGCGKRAERALVTRQPFREWTQRPAPRVCSCLLVPQGPACAPACRPGSCCARPVTAGGGFSSEPLGPQPRQTAGCFSRFAESLSRQPGQYSTADRGRCREKEMTRAGAQATRARLLWRATPLMAAPGQKVPLDLATWVN